MDKLYASPLRVYLALFFVALVGIYCGLNLPVSLFPNSSKPLIRVGASMGGLTPEDFLNSYGRSLENQLRSINTGTAAVEKITAEYTSATASFEVEFKWGAPFREALREVQAVVNGFSGRLPKDIRDTLWVSTWGGGNSGFLAVSFYSEKRSLNDVYNLIEPLLTPKLGSIQGDSNLYNPMYKEIQIELKPEKMAALQLLPRHVQTALYSSLVGSAGGQVSAGISRIDVVMDRQSISIEDLGRVMIPTPGGPSVHLSEIASVDYGAPVNAQNSFRTSGAPSIILFASPKVGGNVKKMSEDILGAINEILPTLPDDIQYKVLVDPSEFIRSAVKNVVHEVFLAAFLAVLVLFLFIGNFKNVITAAIEIPMSIVLAFILMRLTGINLNLISLGGLALSAGMNVDASVVVMENIFRHFEEHKGALDFKTRLRIVTEAVSEVRFPIIASTIASVVVFLPLAFTSGLSNAILADLALAVVFSHGFSAIVALILVPTVRLQLMKNGAANVGHSPIEGFLKKMESTYALLLDKFLSSKKIKNITYGAIVGSIVLLVLVVLPRLPREIVGKPDTDWIMLNESVEGNTNIKQMESQAEETEAALINKFGGDIHYTFTQIGGPNSALIMARLKDKSQMEKIKKDMENVFPNTPFIRYSVWQWNPSELRIPDPPEMELAIRGGTARDRFRLGRELRNSLEEQKYLSDTYSEPSVSRNEFIALTPQPERWTLLERKGNIVKSDLTDISRIASNGQRLGELAVEGKLVNINLRYPFQQINSVEDLQNFPIGIGTKLVPLKSLVSFSVKEALPTVKRENEKEVISIFGRMKKDDKQNTTSAIEKSKKYVEDWMANNKNFAPGVTATFEDAQKVLTDALHELGWAVALSILLIFLTMVFQFGDVINALLVLVAVPLGFIGVLLSLFIFKSTLSLNSVLGVILLNGIAVANSIILVDFLKRLVEQGRSPREAALEAAQKRLRPIVMTSLTTGLGMLPVALGFGEGGKILQPLGIAVIGGLGFSTTMTLFLVPALQVSYLNWKNKKKEKRERRSYSPRYEDVTL